MYTRDGKDGFPSEDEFEGLLAEYIAALNPRKREKALMTQAMYDSILTILMNPDNTRHATAQFRFWTKKMFRLVTTAHAQVVTHENRPVAVKEQIYDVLVQCHSQCSHGGRDKTSNQVRRYYSWIPKELIARFVKACPLCAARRQSKIGGGQFGYADDASSPVSETGTHTPKSTQTTPSSIAVKTAKSLDGAHPMFAALFPPMPAPSQNPEDWSSMPQNSTEWTDWVTSTPQRPNQQQPQQTAYQQEQLYPHQQTLPTHMQSRPSSASGNCAGQQSQLETDVFGSAEISSGQSGVLTPRTMDLVNGWSMPPPQDAIEAAGRQGYMAALSHNVERSLFPPGIPSSARRFSFESNLTVGSTDSERPGSSHSSALSLPDTPEEQTSRQPPTLDVNPQEVNDYFNQYGDGMDAVTQAASLEGLAGIALMKGVVEATSADLARSSSSNSNTSSGMGGQTGQDGIQPRITIEEPQAEEQHFRGQQQNLQQPASESFCPYSDQLGLQDGLVQYQSSQYDAQNSSFDGQVEQNSLYTQAGNIAATSEASFDGGQFYASFPQYDGDISSGSMIQNGSGDSSFESVALGVEGEEAGNTSEFRVKVRPPPLDLGAFSNINMLQANSFLGTAFNYNLSGSVSAPAQITHFPDAYSPNTGHFDQNYMMPNASFDGISMPHLTAGDDANANRPNSAMGFLHPHNQPFPSSWSSSSSSGLSSCSSLGSSGSYFVPPLSIVPAIHSAPFFQMPLSSQQQQAASRELSESIQHLLESTKPNVNAKPEKRPKIDPKYRKLLAGLQKH